MRFVLTAPVLPGILDGEIAEGQEIPLKILRTEISLHTHRNQSTVLPSYLRRRSCAVLDKTMLAQSMLFLLHIEISHLVQELAERVGPHFPFGSLLHSRENKTARSTRRRPRSLPEWCLS